MIYLYAFLFSGIVCLICQVVFDNIKITPGHITTSVTVIGAFLSFFGIYDIFIKYAGAGATILISNFGHMLYKGAIAGYEANGFLGLFQGMMSSSATALVSVIVVSFCLTIIFRAKD